MRGQQGLFFDLVEPLAPEQVFRGNGRSADLIEARNKRLFYRYYYFSHILRRQYGDAISIIAAEFDLREFSVIKTLQQNSDQVRLIFKEKKTVKELAKMYHWLKWEN